MVFKGTTDIDGWPVRGNKGMYIPLKQVFVGKANHKRALRGVLLLLKRKVRPTVLCHGIKYFKVLSHCAALYPSKTNKRAEKPLK